LKEYTFGNQFNPRSEADGSTFEKKKLERATKSVQTKGLT
jgi:hypothetical protein